MIEAANLQGEKLIVMTAAEYASLVEDIADSALAAEAKRASAAAPLISADLLEASLNGAMHPLTAWRKAAKLTMADLAERANIRAATISDIENGKLDPRFSTVKALSEALGVDADDIMS